MAAAHPFHLGPRCSLNGLRRVAEKQRRRAWAQGTEDGLAGRGLKSRGGLKAGGVVAVAGASGVSLMPRYREVTHYWPR